MHNTRGRARQAGLTIGFLILSSLFTTPAHASVSHYASPNGSGTECSQSSPCALQTAIALAAPEDFVYLYADQGTYQLGSNISTLPNTPIKVRSFNGRAQLFFSSGGLSLTGGDVDGISVHGAADTTALSLGGTAVATRVIAQAGSGQPACSLNHAKMLNSICSATAEAGSLAVETDATNVLRNDTFVGGTEAAVKAFGRNSACGCSTATDTLINVIARSAQGGTDIELNSDGATTVTVSATYSNFATSSVTGSGTSAMAVLKQDGTDQTASPVFQSQPPGDVHEAPSSPTIDAGKNSSSNSIYDIDGNPRTMGTRTDIGADEFVSPPDTAITATVIKSSEHKVTFRFKSLGPSTGLECQFTPNPTGVIPPFKPCTSPKTYGHLAKGRYRLKVRAVGPGGTDATPAKKAIRI